MKLKLISLFFIFNISSLFSFCQYHKAEFEKFDDQEKRWLLRAIPGLAIGALELGYIYSCFKAKNSSNLGQKFKEVFFDIFPKKQNWPSEDNILKLSGALALNTVAPVVYYKRFVKSSGLDCRDVFKKIKKDVKNLEKNFQYKKDDFETIPSGFDFQNQFLKVDFSEFENASSVFGLCSYSSKLNVGEAIFKHSCENKKYDYLKKDVEDFLKKSRDSFSLALFKSLEVLNFELDKSLQSFENVLKKGDLVDFYAIKSYYNHSETSFCNAVFEFSRINNSLNNLRMTLKNYQSYCKKTKNTGALFQIYSQINVKLNLILEKVSKIVETVKENPEYKLHCEKYEEIIRKRDAEAKEAQMFELEKRRLEAQAAKDYAKAAQRKADAYKKEADAKKKQAEARRENVGAVNDAFGRKPR